MDPGDDATRVAEDLSRRELAFSRWQPGRRGTSPGTLEEVERGLHLVGIVGLEDPAASRCPASLTACRRAGIKVAMVTGDHPGRPPPSPMPSRCCATPESPVLVRAQLPSDDGVLGAVVDRDGLVVARASSPEDKLRNRSGPHGGRRGTWWR